MDKDKDKDKDGAIEQSRRFAGALVLAVVACATTGCEVLGAVARVSDDERCEREARTYDDQKACKARQKSLDDYENRRKSKDEELRLGPKKS